MRKYWLNEKLRQCYVRQGILTLQRTGLHLRALSLLDIMFQLEALQNTQIEDNLQKKSLFLNAASFRTADSPWFCQSKDQASLTEKLLLGAAAS